MTFSKNEDQEIVKQKYVEILQKRMKVKDYLFAPFHNELKSLHLPTIDLYKKHFGSYNSVCKLLDKEPLFNKPLPKDFTKINLKNETILKINWVFTDESNLDDMKKKIKLFILGGQRNMEGEGSWVTDIKNTPLAKPQKALY